METDLALEDALEELSTAEDFLEYFKVPYEPSVVQVNRLHILQRLHDYLARYASPMPEAEDEARALYCTWLTQAYEDFVKSDSLTEKVFAVFHTRAVEGGGMSSFVPLEKAFR